MSSLFTFNKSNQRILQASLLGARLHPFAAASQANGAARSLLLKPADQQLLHVEEEVVSHSEGIEIHGAHSFNEREDDEVREFTAFKRFRPGGPHPPVPPVGGQFITQDAFVDSINSKSLQTSRKYFSENIQNQTFTDKSATNNHERITEPSTESTELTSNLESQSKFTSPSDRIFSSSSPTIFSSPNSHQFQSTLDSTPLFPQFENVTKKRDQKLASKVECKGCHVPFHKLKQEGFCHNCFKIYEAVELFVHQNNGVFAFSDRKTAFLLTCENGHQWKTDFKTKQVKKWCKACRKRAHLSRKELIKQQDEELFREQQRVQKELFDQAKTSASSSFHFDSDEEEHDFSHHSFHPPHHHGSHHGRGEQFEEIKLSQHFLSFLLEGEERIQVVDAHQVVEFLVREPESRLERFFERLEQEQRVKAYKRLARLVHPDKNSHSLAKEAFQKMIKCMRIRNQMRWKMYWFLFEAEEDECI